MRMRKKKYLSERLGAVSDYLYISENADRNFNTAMLNKDYIDFENWFTDSHPLYLEIGCGCGSFAVEYARTHPDINLIAVEKNVNVLVSACEKAKAANSPNLRFICCSAEYIERHIAGNSIARVFLNFSCPFPKKSYAAHRLTNHTFLNIYKRLMRPDAEIHQKTDNMHFFEFSCEQFSANGFALKNISLDLHASGFEGNIETEYEQRFSALGKPIYRLEAYLR